MTPGAYLRHCREAAGLTLDDVATKIETLPPVDAFRRRRWLADMERADAPFPAVGTLLRLATIYAVDWYELLELSERHPAPIETSETLRMCLVRGDGAVRRTAAAATAASREITS